MPHLPNGFQIRPPGEPKGPCTDPCCELETCRSARALALVRCEACHEEIGYGRQMLLRAVVTAPLGRELIVVRHRRCDLNAPMTG